MPSTEKIPKIDFKSALTIFDGKNKEIEADNFVRNPLLGNYLITDYGRSGLPPFSYFSLYINIHITTAYGNNSCNQHIFLTCSTSCTSLFQKH